MRSRDWSKTPLGPPESWPQSLRTATSILLNSRYPMFLAWGPALAFIYNDGYRPIFGDKHPDALGQPFARVWSEIWLDISPLVERALAGEPTFSEDLLLFMERRGYPEEVYFTFSYSPIRDETGGIGGMFCACTETTAAVLSRRRLRTLSDLAAAAAAAQVKNVDETQATCLHVLEGNREDIPFALLYRFGPDPAEPRFAGSAGIAPDASTATGTAIFEAARWPLAAVAQGESRLVASLASRVGDVPSSVWCDPIDAAVVLPVPRRDQGEVSAALVLGVNPRRALDDEYRLFLDRVAGAVATATANAQAFEVERNRAEALAEIDRAKTAFFSNVSHEFRTPLTLMLGPLEETLRRGNLDRRDQEEIAVVHRSGLRLLKLVNTLLDFSRVEAGRVQAVYRSTDLSAFTAELASSFRSACERAGLRLSIDCPPLPQPVYVDQDMWEKVVLNLLSNAFKFTFEGEIAVIVRARASAAEMTVRDTGTGIPATELPHVFERFHRIEGAPGRTHEGTGIGLALVQELVKLHGGTVTVESAPGAGSAFAVAIPFGTAHLPADRIGADRTQASTALRAEAFVEEALRWLGQDQAADIETGLDPLSPPASAGAERARVLLADDNADMRDYVRRLLTPRYKVETVSDGQTALAAARAHRPDLILSDVMMPRLDGLGLVAALRADPALRDLPIILLSARAGEEARVEGFGAGADDYLTKPFSSRELVALVGTHIELSRVRREATAALRDSEARFRNMADNAPVMVWTTDPTGSCTYLSRSWYEFTGQTPETGLGLGWLDATHPDDRAEAERVFLNAHAAREDFRLECRVRGADGEYRWMINAASPWLGDRGEFRGYIGSIIDITERKRSEERQALLVNELNHRVKNTLATVQSLAMQTLRSTERSADARALFEARLAALSRAHDVLTLHNWESAQLQEIVARAVQPFQTADDRIATDGPEVRLSPKQAMALSMALHELATNAAKYGALSKDSGRVRIAWSLAPADVGGELLLTWTEMGGPPVAPPKRKGFGSRLIGRSLATELDGRVSIDYRPEGVVCLIATPILPAAAFQAESPISKAWEI